MTIIGELLLPNLLAYLINLAAGERSAAIAAKREVELRDTLEKNEALRKALDSRHSIRDEVRGACAELARNRATMNVPAHEEHLWKLLSDDVFQDDLVVWLQAGAILEGNDAKERLLRAMELAVTEAGGTAEQIASLKSCYFEALERTIYANPVLARWRHQLSLDYLSEQVTVLRQHAEEAAGVFSPEKQEAAIECYCEKALAAWDIIDLSNLPEGDIHMATQKLLLRQLYMPLRIEVETARQGEDDEAVLARMEEEREARRHREAGHSMTDGPDRPDGQKTCVPVGERLATSRRLVVLGDPGGGKTTMLRWMATAYLLRHKGDAAFSQVPDTKTLPGRSLIPVLIRCRDLGEADLCRCFGDFLNQHLNKTELLPEEAEVMRTVILDRIAKGDALLLVDGLDEITNPRVRIMFCQELERIAARYPDAPIVVTSRIVGYRDMPYRMGSGFEHGQIAELNREDKDIFARRWVEVTEQHQPAAEKEKRAQELLDALHSNDRIERLTGNPMLLTTLALVKRKVGKLPNKRNKLYAEAVSVLLNWNPRLYQAIEEDEAIPQLEYLAYEMCRRGVQRLTDDEVLNLLDKIRDEYPNVRAIKRREPHVFLKLLEERSSILIKSGGIWHKNFKPDKAVWEFRHLTFQEYLAARALLDGRYPGRDRTRTLAEQVAPLVGAVQKVTSRHNGFGEDEEHEVPESWREALRLLVADCKDDDVDDVLLSILNPVNGEDTAKTARPRAVLAALCLANEPNIGENTARQVLDVFASIVGKGDGKGHVRTIVDRTALGIRASLWSQMLKSSLIEEYCRRPPATRNGPGALWGMIEVAGWRWLKLESRQAFESLVERLNSRDKIEVLSAALVTMAAAFEGKAVNVPGLIAALFALLVKKGAESFAGAWALGWLSGGPITSSKKPIWLPSDVECDDIIKVLTSAPEDEGELKICLVHILGKVPRPKNLEACISQLVEDDVGLIRSVCEVVVKLDDKKAVSPLLEKLDSPDEEVRCFVIGALGKLGDKQSIVPLLVKLDDPDKNVRLSVIKVLLKFGDKQVVAPLLRKLDDPDEDVRLAVIEALGRLGDKQAVTPLLAKLDVADKRIGASVAAALHAMGEQSHLARLVASSDCGIRLACIRAYAQYKDLLDRQLLTHDLDGVDPWIDPGEVVSDEHVSNVVNRLNMSPDRVRARFEVMAEELNIKLSWKT